MTSDQKKNLKQITSTQAFSPIRDVQDGIVITKDDRFVKIMEFSPINFGLRSHAEQDTIITQFASVIRTMPKTVQFKVISRKTDVERFVRKIEMEMETENVPGCRRLQEDQAGLIRSVSANQGISRRFFLAFEYEEKAGLQRRPSFEQIAASLNREGRSIRAALEQCGNELLSRDHDDEYTLSVLYSIMSRAEAEARPFEEREFDVLARYASSTNIDFSQQLYIPVNDFIAPTTIDARTSPSYLAVDDLYYMFCYLPSSAYPVRAVGGWLSILINMGEGVDVDLWIHKEDIVSTQRKLQYRLRYNKVKMRETEDTSQDYDDLMAAIQSGYYLKQGMASNEDFCYMATMVTITAHDLNTLRYKYNEIQKHCIRNSMKIKLCVFQQLDSFKAALPICSYNPGIWSKSRRNILTSSLASAYPFVSYELTDENGILLGTNHDNGSLVFVDIFDTKRYNNANVAILGSSGAGKTYTLQCMALRMRQKQVQVFIIAPLKGIEFERACAAVGGSFIRIAPGSGNNINIMEIRKKEDAEEQALSTGAAQNSILMAKIQQLHTFFSLLVKDITFEETQIVDEALIKTYEHFGITSKNKSLFDPAHPGKYRKMPTLGDLHKTLKDMDNAGRLYSVLTRYVTGSAKSFNQHTNVNLENKYVVLDVSTLTDEMLPIGMFIALDYVWDKARENRTEKKCIFVDETWKLVGTGSSPQAAKFVLEIFKIIRGYGGSAVAATQDLNDFFALEDGIYGQGIINNAKTKLLMKTEPKEAEVVAQAMDLTASEMQEIKKLSRGTCLLAANTNHIFIDIKASESEHNLITTDASDLRRQAREREGMAI